MYRACVFVLITLTAAYVRADDPPAPRRVTLKFGHQEPEPFNPQRWLFSPEVVADKDGTVRLARSVLLANEIGATEHHQADTLSDQIWARVELSGPPLRRTGKPIERAELFAYGSPKVVEFNAKRLPAPKRHESTGWTRVPVATEWLATGMQSAEGNLVTLRDGGTLLFEPRGRAGESEKSTDAGGSWSPHALGADRDAMGEYLIRLRVAAHPLDGWAESTVFDLWAPNGAALATPGQTVLWRTEPLWLRPAGNSRIRMYVRTGSTQTPDPKTWSPWTRLLAVTRLENYEQHRWAQLRCTFFCGRDGQTVRMPERFGLEYSFVGDTLPDDRLTVVKRPAEERVPRITSVPFIYQKPSPRLKYLREKYELDKVIAPGKTEMEQLMLLRHWVRNQWHTAWGNHPAAWMPPWDSLQILACKDQPDCLTMCTHYACVFTQCCLALGWNARHCILDHHCVSEVWVDQHQKWVMMDAGNSPTRPDCNLHFERNGVPLSALELHFAQRDKKTEGITVCFTPTRLMDAIASLCRPAPKPGPQGAGLGTTSPRPDTIPLAELKNYPVCGLENYRRYAFPARNNYLDSLYPGELYQGWAEYFYDGYWWVGDERDDPQLSPEYSKHLPPSRPQDIDWDLNWTRIHLCRTKTPGELQVDLETFTPNLERLETARGNGSEFKPTPASFVWKLEAGRNTLRARSVNSWGRLGKPAEIVVGWQRGE